MVILRTSLNQGNAQVKQVMNTTKHDKEKTYNKIVANMLENCYSSIEDNVVNKILQPENLNLWEASFEKYLKFNKSVFQIIGPEPKLTPSEQFIINDIAKAVANPGIDIPVQDEKVDFMTEKLGKYKFMAIGTTIGFTISFVFVLFYNLCIKK